MGSRIEVGVRRPVSQAHTGRIMSLRSFSPLALNVSRAGSTLFQHRAAAAHSPCQCRRLSNCWPRWKAKTRLDVACTMWMRLQAANSTWRRSCPGQFSIHLPASEVQRRTEHEPHLFYTILKIKIIDCEENVPARARYNMVGVFEQCADASLELTNT